MIATASPVSTPSEPRLVEVASGRVFALGPITTIGRDPDSTVCLSDMMVGKRHAEVRRLDDGSFELSDLASRHGTYVGGRRVSKVVLEAGDEILIGSSRLRYEKGSPPAVNPAPSTVRMDGGGLGSMMRRLSVWDASRFAPASQITAPEELARDYEKLRAALEVSRTIGVEHDLTKLLERLLAAAFQLLPAERGAVLLLDGNTGGPVAEISRTRTGDLEPLTVPSSLIQEVLQQQAGVLTANAEFDDRFSRSSSIVAQGIRSAMCVPMLYRGLADSGSNQHEILGVMYLDSRLAVGAFSPRDLDLFTSIANQAALALKNAVLVQHIRAVKAAEGKRVEQVVRNLPAGVILLDSDRRISLVNPQVEPLLALLGGPRPGDVLQQIGSLSIDEVLAADRGELEIIVRGPPRRILAVSAAAFASGADQGAVLTLRDITDERERETKAAHEERLTLLGRLAGGIAHDFNNLLTVIISSTEFAMAGAAGGDEQLAADLVMVRDAAERAAALTRQLLAFGRRELIKPKVVDVNQLVTQIKDLLRRTLGSTIEIRSRFTDPLPAVKIDPAQFERVLANLVVNARDAMPDGGVVTLETDIVQLDEAAARGHQGLQPGPHVCLTARDTGVGMPPEVLARIFEPFFTTKEKGKGTGLGLATVYGVVRQAGGAVTVESTPGQGTVFRVLLPTSSEQEVTQTKRVTMMMPTFGATILLAEDLAPVLGLTERMLQRYGYQVLTARDGEEAMATALSHPGQIDLLLTDILMPKMSGWTLAERLRTVRPNLRVLFVSGQVDDQVDSMAIGADGMAFLPKPYTADELLEQVRVLLESPIRRPPPS